MIFLPPLIEPKVWTKKLKDAYTKCLYADLAYSEAYLETASLLGMFSIRRHKDLKRARSEAQKARDYYTELLPQVSELNIAKWEHDYKESFNAQCPFKDLRI